MAANTDAVLSTQTHVSNWILFDGIWNDDKAWQDQDVWNDADPMQGPSVVEFDISFDSDGDILTKDSFDTSIQMSILCERRADPSEVPDAIRRRGWIGNVLSDTPGFEIGSKLWLYEQSRLTNDTLNGVKGAAIEATQWLIDDELAKNIEASITRNTKTGKMELKMTIEFSSGQVAQRFFDLWENTGT
jgi:phage gp46-like protein